MEVLLTEILRGGNLESVLAAAGQRLKQKDGSFPGRIGRANICKTGTCKLRICLAYQHSRVGRNPDHEHPTCWVCVGVTFLEGFWARLLIIQNACIL